MVKLPLLIIKTVSDHGLVPPYPADYGTRFLTHGPLRMIVDERPSVVRHQSYSLCWKGGDQLCFGADAESVVEALSSPFRIFHPTRFSAGTLLMCALLYTKRCVVRGFGHRVGPRTTSPAQYPTFFIIARGSPTL